MTHEGWRGPLIAPAVDAWHVHPMPGPDKDPYLWRKIVIVGAALLLAVIATYVTIIMPRQPEKHSDAARGTVIYAANCAGCHGHNLEGQPGWHHVNTAGRLPAPPLDGTGHAWRHSNAELFHMVKFSVLDEAGPGYRTDMPAFDNKLTDDDIRRVLAYIHGRWPSGIQAAQAFLNPDHAGMPDHVDADWRLPADCEEPGRGKPIPIARTTGEGAPIQFQP
jgi:mono/diheme cytochrome c family protein